MIRTSDIGWAAGFYEGEGSFLEPGYVTITQKDPEPLYRIQHLFGGVAPKKYGEYYYWRIYDLEMRQFVLTIFTFLSKRRRAQILKYRHKFTEGDRCPNGHQYPVNAKQYYNTRTGGSYRTCKPCRREHQWRRSAKRRAARLKIVKAS